MLLPRAQADVPDWDSDSDDDEEGAPAVCASVSSFSSVTTSELDAPQPGAALASDLALNCCAPVSTACTSVPTTDAHEEQRTYVRAEPSSDPDAGAVKLQRHAIEAELAILTAAKLTAGEARPSAPQPRTPQS